MRSIVELLMHLRGQGVALALEGETLKCSAPKGVLTAELRDELTLRKPELIAFLRSSRETVLNGGSGIPRISRGGKLPLSFAQQRLWFLHQLEPENPAYNIAAALRLTGELHPNHLESALSSILARHEALRTSFIQTDGEPQAVILNEPKWALASVDLTDLPAAQREAELRARLREMGRQPFDLSQGPLFRATLFVTATDNYVLLLTLHHIIADGWSLGVFTRELGEYYRARLEGAEPMLQPLPIQYADFSVWQRRWLEGGELEKQLPYWKQQLAGAPPLSLFPPDHRGGATVGFEGGRRVMVISREMVTALEEFSRREGVTLFMMLLAAFDVLLFRYTGQSDLVVGTASANRNRPELHGLIGFFVNNLVMRANLEGNPTFRTVLTQVRDTSLGAYDHQDVPFDILVRAVGAERAAEHSPLFQTMFTLQNFPFEDVELCGIKVRPMQVDFGIVRFDLSVEVYLRRGKLRAVFDYDTRLYGPEMVEQIQRHYLAVLRSVLANPEQPIESIPLLLPEEQDTVLKRWNATEVGGTDARCFYQRFEAQASATPDRVAVIVGRNSLTYRELNQWANQIAQSLVSSGVAPGTLVGVFVERSPAMVAALLGVMKSGGAYVPLDPIYPKQRIAGILEDAAPKLILTSSFLRGSLPATEATIVCLNDLPHLADAVTWENLPARARLQDLAYVIFTSGSTGRPKGVQISHASLMNFLESMEREPGFTSDDVLLAVTTISFDIAGLELYLPLLAGGRLCLAVDPGNPEALLYDLERMRPTVMQATPATWQLLLSAGWQGDLGLKALCGGEAMEPDLAHALLDRMQSLWNMYGPTETTIWSAALRVTTSEDDTVPIGHPIANTTFYVVDTHRQPVPIGVAGELLIGGAGLARGYLNRPELTRERFIDDPFSRKPGARLYRTGDLVRYRRDGTLEFLGRMDHQVKLRGFRIELGEIESVLRQQPGVQAAVVNLRQTGEDKQDKELVAWLMVEGEHSGDSAQVRNSLRPLLPEYMIPSRIVFLQELPRTLNGKLDRHALPLPDRSSGVKRNVSLEALTPVESAIASVFAELLGTGQIDIHDNFFDLGAHSLMLVRAHERLKREVAPQLTLLNFFQYPTIAALAKFSSSLSSSALVNGGSSGNSRSVAQQ